MFRIIEVHKNSKESYDTLLDNMNVISSEEILLIDWTDNSIELLHYCDKYRENNWIHQRLEKQCRYCFTFRDPEAIRLVKIIGKNLDRTSFSASGYVLNTK